MGSHPKSPRNPDWHQRQYDLLRELGAKNGSVLPERKDYLMPVPFWFGSHGPEVGTSYDLPPAQHRDSRGNPITLPPVSILEKYDEEGNPR